MSNIRICGWKEACFVNHDGGVVTDSTAPLSIRLVGKKLSETIRLLGNLGWMVHSGGDYVTFLVRGRKKRINVDKGDSL